VRTAAEVLVALAFAALFAAATGVVAPDAWYSPDPSYRLQTQAFLDGRLALQELPFHHRVDWILGRGGMHQGWGLGVPLLRLPFEAGARLAGAAGFPDRVVFLLFHALVGGLLLHALRRPGAERPPEAVHAWLLRPALVAGMVLSPSLLAMAHVRFHVYEEAVAFGVLATFAVFALLLELQAAPTARRWAALALAAGGIVLIRPTALFAGALSALLGLALAARAGLGRRALVAGGALFAVGPAVVLVGNALRFGSPLEFGYSLSFSGTPVDLLSLRFGYPFESVDLGTAVHELFSWLFRAERHTRIEWLSVPWPPYRTDVLRFRESYFSTFDLPVAVLLAASWGLGIVGLARARGALRRLPPVSARPLLMLAWSAALFALLFVFYLRSPTLSSRYTMDFLPAVAVGLAGGLLAARDLVAGRSRAAGAAAGAAAALAIAVWIPASAWSAFGVEGRAYRPAPRAADAARVQAQLARREALAQARPPVPDAYTCPGGSPVPGLPYNLLGWDHRRGCGVDLVTQAFFERTPCISLLVSAGPAALAAMEARVNYDRPRRVAVEREGDRERVVLCRPLESLQVDSPVQAWSIRWARLTPTVPEVPPLRLHEIRREPLRTPPAPGGR